MTRWTTVLLGDGFGSAAEDPRGVGVGSADRASGVDVALMPGVARRGDGGGVGVETVGGDGGCGRSGDPEGEGDGDARAPYDANAGGADNKPTSGGSTHTMAARVAAAPRRRLTPRPATPGHSPPADGWAG
jgi:hypothetical protein